MHCSIHNLKQVFNSYYWGVFYVGIVWYEHIGFSLRNFASQLQSVTLIYSSKQALSWCMLVWKI